MNCDDPDYSNWLTAFNEEIEKAIDESAPPPTTFYLWLPGDSE